MDSLVTRSFNQTRALITGGLGFIGSTVARQLLELGAQVTIIDNLFPNHGGNSLNIEGLENDLRVVIADIRDPEALCEPIATNDLIINLAGQTSHHDSMADPYTDLEINCLAQLHILEACRKHNRDAKVVFASTRQVYGKPDRLPVPESHLLRPVDVNGINKMAGEWYHILYSRVYGIAGCSLRLTNTYGPRMRVKDARQTFLGLWIRCLLEGRPFEVWGGSQLRDFTFVDDAVDAFLLAASSDAANGKIYNLGGDRVISLADLARLLTAINGGGDYTRCPFPDERRKIDIGDYYADDSRIREDLGWRPKVGLEAGLSRTLEYFRNHLERYL